MSRKMKTVFVVTTMRFGFKYGNRKRSADGRFHSYEKRTSPSQRAHFCILSSRTWGWLSCIESAQEAVERNYGDIYEHEYDHAVIEEIAEGILHGGVLPNEWWYKWKGSWERGGFKPWKKPKEYDPVICFMDRMKGIRAHWGDVGDEKL